MTYSSLLLLSVISLSGYTGAQEVIRAQDGKAISGAYIVTLTENKISGLMSQDEITELIKGRAESVTANANGTLTRLFSDALHGFVVTGLSDAEANNVLKDDMVASVEEDAIVELNAVGSWGLDRIDDKDLPLDKTYNPTFGNNGAGVTAYIIDTGIMVSHKEFEGRATQGFNSIDGDPNKDCNGHGTHVAGTVGSKTYGVANKCNLVGVKVLSCEGYGSNSGVIAGIDWVKKNAKKPATANMSLGGSKSAALNTAVRNLVNSGVTTVVAAGNDNSNACNSSPASESSVITVGSTDNKDKRSSFSNWGTCLDIFAPGSDITAPWIDSKTDTYTISGTSMASPHVCGAVALYLGDDDTLTPANILSKLMANSVDGTIKNVGKRSPNKFLYVGESCADIKGKSKCVAANCTYDKKKKECKSCSMFSGSKCKKAECALVKGKKGGCVACGTLSKKNCTKKNKGQGFCAYKKNKCIFSKKGNLDGGDDTDSSNDGSVM